MRFAAIGLDHRHVYHMVGGLLEAGATCVGFDPATSDARVLAGFRERFPTLPESPADRLIDDPDIDLIVCAAIPAQRAAIAVRAMRAGKDVMVDKPGVTDFDQLAAVERAVAETGRIFSVCFSERFIVPSTIVAGKLIADGAIGRVVQTIGLGPHRFNRAVRPDWFFDKRHYGGILTDIASHQIDQFLHFTGSPEAQIVASGVGHFGGPEFPEFEDSARSCCAATGPEAISGSTGSPPTACRHGATGASPSSAPRAPSNCANMSTSPADPAPTTSSSSTRAARAMSTPRRSRSAISAT